MPLRKPSDGEKRLTFAELVKLYGIPERTLRRWIADGRLPPPIKDGRRHVWRESDVDKCFAVPDDEKTLYERKWPCTPLEKALVADLWNRLVVSRPQKGTAEIFTDPDDKPDIGFLRLPLGKHIAIVGIHAPKWKPLGKDGKFSPLPSEGIEASYVVSLERD